MTDPASYLGEPAFRLRWHGDGARYTVSQPNIGDTDCYTAEQCLAAVQRALAAQQAQLPTPEAIEAAAHRTASRYKHDGEAPGAHLYTFNRHTLMDFAARLAAPQQAAPACTWPDCGCIRVIGGGCAKGFEVQAAPATDKESLTVGAAPAEPYPRCTDVLRKAGKAYPRTCAECGLGPCKRGQAAPAGQAAAPVAFVPVHPRTGPLWSETFPAASDVSQSRPRSYPLMALCIQAPAAEAVQSPLPLPVAVNHALLNTAGTELLREWALIGPVQRAALESFAEALLAAGPKAEAVQPPAQAVRLTDRQLLECRRWDGESHDGWLDRIESFRAVERAVWAANGLRGE